MSKELISVIVPVYNVENYLDDCIRSLIAQDYSNLEIIFVNDGSTDNSLQILNKWRLKNKKIKVISNENKGVSSARNIGISIAKGSLIYMCDPDDFLHPKTLSILENILTTNNADVAVCNLAYIKENYKFDINKIKRIRRLKTEIKYGTEQILIQFMSMKKILNICTNKLFRVSLMKKLIDYPSVFDEKCYYGEDFDFTFRYFIKCNKMIYTNCALYYNRKRKGSATHSKFNENKLTIRNCENYLDSLKKRDFPNAYVYFKAKKCDLCAATLFLICNSNYSNKEYIKRTYYDFKTNLKYCFKCKKSIIAIKYFMWCRLPYYYFKLHKYLK